MFRGVKDTDVKVPHSYMQAGQIMYSRFSACLCAACGNGVLVTIYDPVARHGGMAHCVFPKLQNRGKRSNYYVRDALATLHAVLSKKFPLSPKAEAQLFGGGHYYGMKKERAALLISEVKRHLQKLNIRIVSEDTGGTIGRKVMFNTASGETIIYKTKNIRKSDWLPEYPRRP